MSRRNVDPAGCPHPQHSDYSSCPRGTMHCWRAPICGREASRIPAVFHGLWRVAHWLGTEDAADLVRFCPHLVRTMRLETQEAFEQRQRAKVLRRAASHVRPDHLRNVDLEDGGIHRIT